jgi:hypothetical protein
VYETETHFPTDSGAGTSSTTKETAKETAAQATTSAKQVASEVTDTAKQQGRQVAGEVGAQARSVVADVRQTVAGQVRTGHGAATDQVRKFADDLGGLNGGDSDTPAGRIVQQLSQTGHRAADYLQDRGPEGLLDDVQSFARRKPGTFLLAAAAAGFVIGRLGRSTVKAARADNTPTTGAPRATFVEQTYVPQTQTQTYASTTATGYDAGPVPVAQPAADYPATDYPATDYPVGVPDREPLR